MGDRGKKRQHPAQGAVSVGGWPAARCPRLLMTATPVGPPSPSPPPGATDVCSGAREQLGWHEFKTHDRALRAGRARDTLRGSAPPDDPPPRPPSLPACRARGQARGLGGRGRTCRRGWRGRRGRTRRPPARDGGGLGWRWWRRFRATQRPPGRRWGPAADARAFPRLGASPRRPPPPLPLQRLLHPPLPTAVRGRLPDGTPPPPSPVAPPLPSLAGCVRLRELVLGGRQVLAPRRRTCSCTSCTVFNLPTDGDAQA